MGLMQWVVERVIDYATDHPPSSPEALERIRLHRLSAHVGSVALRHATSSSEDDAAAVALRRELGDQREGVAKAITYLGDPRDNFLYDRAYRLLTAAVDGGAVRPIDPVVRDVFLAEEHLGRLTLREAFASLAQTEPRLLEVEREIITRRPDFARDASQQTMFDITSNRIESLVGFGARGQGWLLRSDVTQAVVLRYLLAVAGARGEDVSRPLFDQPRSCTRGHLLWGLKRPAATN